MDYKDTVMNIYDISKRWEDDWLSNCAGAYRAREICKKQAEISFKAGIKEVVDWLKNNCNDVITVSEMQGLDDWNEQLKEWGIG